MPAPVFTRAAHLERLSSGLRSALSTLDRIEPAVAAMSRGELDAAYAELDQLRSEVMVAIEAVMVRRRAESAVDQLEAELAKVESPDEREKLQALFAEHAELIASLR